MSFCRRNLFIPLSVLKDVSPRLKYLKSLNKSQYLNLSELKECQFDRFKNILEHAYEHSFYYKRIFNEYDVHPKDIQDENDLMKLPILTKKDISRNTNDIISYANKKNLYPFKTGGSTGKPLTIYRDFRTIELSSAGALRSLMWTGWKTGEPWGRIWGNPHQNKSFKEKLQNLLLHKEIYLDTMNLTDDSMLNFIHRWRKTKPSLMHGHSHSLYIFAQVCKRKDINDIIPKAIISTSMMLMPSERKSIEEAFQCQVTDLYGCEEVGLIGCECEKHNGMHLNMENVLVEFIDHNGKAASPGEQGAIVVTDLINKAMPLIRYKIEDIGIPSIRQCSCGRNLALMEGVTGRVADFLVRKDGTLVAGVSLVERTLTAVPGICQLQIIQEDLNTIVLNLVKDTSYNEDTDKFLINELKKSVGDYNKIELNFVDNIRPESSGKYRFAISKVANPYFDNLNHEGNYSDAK